MPEYSYTARQNSGDSLTGTLTAINEQDALKTLIERSLIPVKVAPISQAKNWIRKSSGRHLAAMYSQLADLLHSGVPLLQCLEILEEQNTNADLASVMHEVRVSVADGTPFADSMATHHKTFSELEISIIRAGEEGGFLEDSLNRVAEYKEQQEDLKSRVIGAFAYPVFLTVAGSIIFVVMLVFFVPRFMPIFDRLAERGELPLPTIVLLAASRLAGEYGLWTACILSLMVWMLVQGLRTNEGRLLIDKMSLRLVGIGPILRQLAIARFCRILGTLLQNGVTILDSLRIAKDVTGNLLLRNAIGNATENISAGRSLAGPLNASGQFPREIIEMINVGERTNRLEKILLDAADNMERRTNRQMDLFVRLLEPLLLLVMAIVILFVLLAILLPVFQSAGGLG